MSMTVTKTVPGLIRFDVDKDAPGGWDATERVIFKQIAVRLPESQKAARRRQARETAAAIATVIVLAALYIGLAVMFATVLIERCGGPGR